MDNNLRKGLELKAILALILPSIFLSLASNLSRNIFFGIAMMLILGTVLGLTLPNIISNWLILILTVLGISLLTLGYVAMSFYGKVLLISSFPIETYLASQLRECIFVWKIYKKNEASAYRYLRHYDQNVKLQTTYNAQKLYKKIVKLLTTNKYLSLWFDFTIVEWEQAQQFSQFNLNEHDQILRRVGKILKKNRLVNENLYYLGNNCFLIISSSVSPATLMILNDELKDKLQELKYGEYQPAFKIATQHLTEKNLYKYENFDAIIKHLKRELETDVVVEYLMGV